MVKPQPSAGPPRLPERAAGAATLWLIGGGPGGGVFPARRRSWATDLIVIMMVLAAGGIFAIDVTFGDGVMVATLYAAVAALCLWLPWRRAVLVVASLASGLTVVSSPVLWGGVVLWPALLNRLLALATIWGVALMVHRLWTMRQDLTRLEVAVERARRSKARFLSAAGHDLRHPIQAGVLFHDLLVRRLRDSPHMELVAHLGQSFAMMQRMLDGLLEVSRLGFGEVEPRLAPVSIAALFERLTPQAVTAAGTAGLRFTVVPSRAVVRSDPELLLRILQNVLDNAFKFTERGRVVLGCRRAGRFLRIQVWDTGIGVPEDRLREIFDEFHQLRLGGRDGAKGLGMGLAVVERLARLLGHAVGVRSVPGRGSMFEVVVPLR